MATDLFLRSKSISNECAMSSRIEINKVKDTWGQEKVKLEQDSQGRCYGNLDGRSAILWKEQAQNTGWISICFGGHYTTNDGFIHIPGTLDILDSEDLLSRRAFHEETVTLDVSTGEGSSSDNSRLSTRAKIWNHRVSQRNYKAPDLPDQNGNSPAYRIQGLQFKEKYLDLLSSVH